MYRKGCRYFDVQWLCYQFRWSKYYSSISNAKALANEFSSYYKYHYFAYLDDNGEVIGIYQNIYYDNEIQKFQSQSIIGIA